MRARERVLCLLASVTRPLSGFLVGQICHVGSWRLYPLLARLEREKLIISGWANEREPRRRLYEIAAQDAGQHTFDAPSKSRERGGGDV